MRVLKTFLVLIAIVVVILGAGGVYYVSGLGAVDPEDTDEISVEIPQGTGASGIVRILDENGLVKNTTVAKIQARIGKYNGLQANTYLFSKSMTLSEMMKAIDTGDFNYVSKQSFEMKEGYRLTQNAELLSKEIPYSKKEILKKWSDETYLREMIDKYWFLTDDILKDDVMYPLEGYLAPNTYFITDSDPTIEGVTETMLDQMDAVLTERKSQIEASGFSVNEFLSLASIVCKEGGSDESQAPHIAGVFINRLNQGMNLGSDVTVAYIFEYDDVDLNTQQLSSDNPYNTRKFAGLTPGPICAVPTVDMDAVLNYEKTNDLFFYAGPDGTIYYAKTNAEHLKNVEAHPWKADTQE